MAKSVKFEDALKQLEECVHKIENDELSIEEAFKIYEKGVKSAACCQKALEQIENRIEILQQDSQGKFVCTETRQNQLEDI